MKSPVPNWELRRLIRDGFRTISVKSGIYGIAIRLFCGDRREKGRKECAHRLPTCILRSTSSLHMRVILVSVPDFCVVRPAMLLDFITSWASWAIIGCPAGVCARAQPRAKLTTDSGTYNNSKKRL